MTNIKKGTGGIQKGQTASSEASLKIDKDLRSIRDELIEEMAHLGVSMKKKITQTGTTTPCEPDGGAWYIGDTLIAAFEAKKQQDHGNAIERWYKNNYVCRTLNENVSYSTWARGEGAYPSGAIGKILDVAHSGEWNVYRAGKNSCWLSKDGFTKQEIKDQMRAILLERLDFYGDRIDMEKSNDDKETKEKE
jgi:hypothetical protein